MKLLRSILLISTLLVFSQCNKTDEPAYTYCTGCPLSVWVGNYNGNGSYYTNASNETIDGVDVFVTITNPYDSTLKINVNAPGYISENFSKSKKDDLPYLSTGSGSRTLDLNLSYKGSEYKLNGTLKRNIFDNKDSVWIVERSLTFQVYK